MKKNKKKKQSPLVSYDPQFTEYLINPNRIGEKIVYKAMDAESGNYLSTTFFNKKYFNRYLSTVNYSKETDYILPPATDIFDYEVNDFGEDLEN
jgi:hypothetical protein